MPPATQAAEDARTSPRGPRRRPRASARRGSRSGADAPSTGPRPPSADCRRRGCRRSARDRPPLMREVADGPGHDRVRGGCGQTGRLDPVPGPGQGQVIGDRAGHHQSLPLPILGDQDDSGGTGLGRATRSSTGRPSTKISPDGSGRCRRARGPAPIRPAPTSPAKPSISPRRSAKLTSCTRALRSPTSRTTAPGFQGGRGKWSLMSRPTIQRTSVVGIELPTRLGADVPPVAQHGDPVGQPAHLLEPVRDVDDAHALLAQPAEPGRRARRSRLRQRGRRLVQDQDPRTDGQCPGDLDHLLLGRCSGRRPEPRDSPISGRPSSATSASASSNIRRRSQQAEPDRLAAEEEVLGHREIGRQRELLVNDPYAQPIGIGHIANLDLPAVHLDRARIGPNHRRRAR